MHKRLLLLSATAIVAFAAFGCSQPAEETTGGTTGAAPVSTEGNAPGKGASAAADLQAAPPGVQTGTPNGK